MYVYQFSTDDCAVADVAPSAAPRQVQGRALNATSILVTWSRPAAARQNGLIVRYRLLYVAADHDDDVDVAGGRALIRDVSSVSVPGSEHSHVLAGLDRWTQYKIWVTAATSAGEGPLSDVIVVQTDEDGMCVELSTSPVITCSGTVFRYTRINLRFITAPVAMLARY